MCLGLINLYFYDLTQKSIFRAKMTFFTLLHEDYNLLKGRLNPTRIDV